MKIVIKLTIGFELSFELAVLNRLSPWKFTCERLENLPVILI